MPAAAAEFYKRAFGATVRSRLASPDGHTVAELANDGNTFFVADESPEYENFSPETLGGCSLDRALRGRSGRRYLQAVSAGAREISPVEDKPFGFRQGRIVDPFGHHWLIGRPLRRERQ